MRTKPLNPNSMSMIMENFKRYQKVLEAEFGEADNVIYLFEDNRKVPTITSTEQLLEDYDSGKITEEKLAETWERSFSYEAQEVARLLEGWEEEARRQAIEADECDVKFNPQACSPEELAAADKGKKGGVYEKLGMLFNKAIDWMISVMKKGVNLVISAAKKAYGWMVEFKKKYPILFKIIVVAIVVIILVTVIYFIFEMVQRLIEDSNIKKQGVAAVPLCGQAAAAAAGVSLQEAKGACFANGVVIDEEEFKVAQGLLEEMKVDYPENAETIAQAQEALTECFKAAQEGKVINLDLLAKGGNNSAQRARAMVAGAQDLLKKGNAFHAAASRARVWDPDKAREYSPAAQRAYAASVAAGGAPPPTHGAWTDPMRDKGEVGGQGALMDELEAVGLDPTDAAKAYFKLNRIAKQGQEYMKNVTPKLKRLLDWESGRGVSPDVVDDPHWGGSVPDWQREMELYAPGSPHLAPSAGGMPLELKESKG